MADIVAELQKEVDDACENFRLMEWAIYEIERLRAAGDVLALSIETFVPGVLAHISIKQAFSDWQEARRG